MTSGTDEVPDVLFLHYRYFYDVSHVEKAAVTKRLQLACIFGGGKYNGIVSKGQTHREVGTQSHGSSNLMRRGWKTARPPN
jgi:hypothetical protein